MSKPKPRIRPKALVFVPAPVLFRHNGWSPLRQAEFIGKLAETRSVSAACAHVGLSRASAYKLRGKPGAESFAGAWDAALGGWKAGAPRKLTFEEAGRRIRYGLMQPVLLAGRHVSTTQKPDNSALLGQFMRLDQLLPEPAWWRKFTEN